MAPCPKTEKQEADRRLLQAEAGGFAHDFQNPDRVFFHVGNAAKLVVGVDLLHAARKHCGGKTEAVENVAVRTATGRTHDRRQTRIFRRRQPNLHNGVGFAQVVGLIFVDDLHMGDGPYRLGFLFKHFLHVGGLFVQFFLRPRPGFANQRRFGRHDVAARPPGNQADVRGRFLVNAAQCHFGNGP